MEIPKLPYPPSITMIANGVTYRVPSGILLKNLRRRYKFRWFKRSIPYFVCKITNKIVYPDWYIVEIFKNAFAKV